MPFKSKYPKSIAPETSLYDFSIEGVRKGKDAVAVIDNSCGGKSITFKEIDEYSQCCAGFLFKQGLRKGDYIGISASGCVEYPVILLGILACGATVTFCNPNFTKDEILQQFRITKPKMVFVEEESVETMKKVRIELNSIESIFVIGKSQEFTSFSDIIRSEHAKEESVHSRCDQCPRILQIFFLYQNEYLNQYHDPVVKEDAIHFHSKMTNVRLCSEFPTGVEINPWEDVALVAYSSGTTGLPKCVMFTHANMTSIFATKDTTDKKVIYIDRPLYHIVGFLYLFQVFARQMKTILNRVEDVNDMLEAVAKYKVTNCVVVPSSMVRCIETDLIDKYDTSSLEVVLCSGAAIAPDVVRKWKNKLNTKLYSVYGMTETTGAIAINLELDRYPTSVGTLWANIEVKIVDQQTDEEVSINKNGEILVKSPSIVNGYLNNDEANKKAFTEDGWFRTGDIGYFDKDERLYLVGRIKEVIKYKTVQVSPAELEGVILKLPQVSDVGVVGIPHEYDGEVPKAFVVRKNNSLSVDQVLAVVKDGLADYKQLRGGVSFVDSIPKSATGKIQRHKLKEMAATMYCL